MCFADEAENMPLYFISKDWLMSVTNFYIGERELTKTLTISTVLFVKSFFF